jgi:predicted dehydrogenase
LRGARAYGNRRRRPFEVIRFTISPINALQFQLEAFARAIEGKTDYLITPQEILNTVEAFEASARAVD